MRVTIAFLVSLIGLVLDVNAIPQANSVYNSPNFGYEELWKLQNQFYDTFRYPNNVKEAEAINSTVFSEDVQGRVSQTRNFAGRELNTEYIFGLFVPSDSISIIGRPGTHEVIQFVANQNIASATTRVNFTFPAFNNYSVPVIIETWMSWNSNKEINQYDVTFRWFGYLLNTLIASMNPADPKDALAQTVTRLANSICATHDNHCHDENAQFKDKTECFDFLTKEIRVGQDFEMGMNTLLCRSVHEVMIKYRPDVHCSHVGRDGGGMCDDSISYRTKAEEQYYTNTPWIPTKF